MARSVNTDPFQNFRYHIVEAGSEGTQFIDPAAGFTTIALPEISVDPSEYKTGIDKFKQKFPGPPTVSDITMSRGIFKGDSLLWEWVQTIINGGSDYRRDLIVYHYHLTDTFDANVQPSRIINLYECWPTTLKPNPDFDAQSAEISLQDLTLACERFDIIYK